MENRRKLIEQIEDKLTIKTPKSAYAGLAFVFLLPILLVIFIFLCNFRVMDSVWVFNIGVNLMGVVTGAVVYYSCLHDSAGVGEHNALFLTLLILSTCSMFLSALCWIVQGVAAFAFLNRLANSLLYLNNYLIVFLFWRCEIFLLEIDQKLERLVNKYIHFFLYPALLLILLSLFVPLFFQVDETGMYRRTAYFPLIFVMIVPVLFGIMAGIITSGSSKKDKLIVSSFIGLPMIVFLLTLIKEEISMSEPTMFVSIMIIYFMLINERGKKLAATETELRMANNIQAAMIPHIFPAFPDRPEISLYASMNPARDVGGDFYDFFLIDDEHLAFLIADVSDKGVPAALFMMAAKILINYRARKGGTPAEILTDINEQIVRDNESKMFVTIWMGILNVNSGLLTCSNAGHEYPAVCTADRMFRIFRDKHGLCVGAMKNIRYRDYELHLNPGDKIFVYTDGVPDANDSAGQFYGLERLEATLNRLSGENPENILHGILKDVDAFTKGAAQFDDLTMLCLEYKGPAGS